MANGVRAKDFTANMAFVKVLSPQTFVVRQNQRDNRLMARDFQRRMLL